MDKLTKKGLDGTQLKTIALVLMVLDHIHYFFEFTGCIPTVFSMLGRLSAPLFLFCTVEGFAHTHDRKRYFIRIWAIGTAMAALEFFMIYAKAFRRGDGFYPQNAIFQDLMLLCIVWQGIDWLRGEKRAKGHVGEEAGKGHCCHCRRLVLAVCGGRISAALPPGAGDAHCFDSRGICHHQPAAHVERHYGRRLELFAGRCAAVCIAWTAQSAADGMGTGDFPV